MGWCPEVCTIFQLRSDQWQIEQNNYLLCLSYDTLVNTFPKGDLTPFLDFMILFSSQGYQIVCTGFGMHTEPRVVSSRALRCRRAPGALGRNPDLPAKGKVAEQPGALTETMRCELLLLLVSIYPVHPKTAVPSY